MTDAEWLTEVDFSRHIQFAVGRLSDRKQRLLAVGLCRAAWHLHTHWDIRVAVEVTERFADGLQSPYEASPQRHGQLAHEAGLRANAVRTQWAGVDPAEELKWWLIRELALAAADATTTPPRVEEVGRRVVGTLVQADIHRLGVRAGSPEEDRLTGMHNRTLRSIVWDVVGSPSRSVAFDPSWRTDTVVSLARRMYDTRDFSPMPILADALQDAGCDNEDLLSHSRQPGVHVRGCWVVDLVLGTG